MTQRNLIIDIGNTNAKILVFEGSHIASTYRTDNQGDEMLECLKNVLSQIGPCPCIVSSVRTENPDLAFFLQEHTSYALQLSSTIPLPINIQYGTPHTLGKDRIAGVVGAHNIFPASNVLVVDAGTAVTYDFLDAEGNYHGGNIAPGVRLRFEALHQFTSKLPLVSASETFSATGCSTETAIQGGVQMGILFEIEGYIRHYQNSFPGLKVILTGGDAFYFAEKLKNTIFAEPNLVPIGLNSILSYYNEKIL